MSINLALSVPASLNSDGLTIRTAGTKDDPLFCLADVCRLFGLSDPSNCSRSLDDDEKKLVDLRTLTNTPCNERGNPNAVFVTEAGLFRIMLTARMRRDETDPVIAARNDLVRRFQRWVCHDVLPCIRRYGCYPVPAGADDPILDAMLQTQAANTAIIEARRAQIVLEQRTEEARRLARAAMLRADAALAVHESNHGCYTVLAWIRLQGRRMDVHEAARHGRALTGVCEQAGIEPGHVRDPRFGQVNTYPEDVLEAYFGALPDGAA